MNLRRWSRTGLLATVLVLIQIPPAHRPDPRGLEASRFRAIPVALEAGDDPNEQADMEFLMLRDPRTNTIPAGIRRREVAFARAIPDRAGWNRAYRANGAAALDPLVWTERGPNNVGGRTRAFAIDVANPSNLLAGSVAGGLWKSVDDGASWSLRTAPGQLHGTTCIAQDTRPGRTHLWYVGTGEIRGSTANNTRWGSLYLGDGIFKSTDHGDSWTLLPATSSGTPQTADAFDFVINVATRPTAPLDRDEVYAATFKGIHRSIDGGNSWSTSLVSDSGYTDVGVTSTGITYAFIRMGSASLWRSPDGVQWTNITPAGFPATVNRVVIGLVPSHPNAVYFFVQGVNSATAGHQLWKYTYLSGNGAGAGGMWVNRGANLPSDLSTQAGYDMMVQVKPDDENFVLIGGTNLYRSTNGFATANTYSVIGGYPYWPDAGHHPDVHTGAFRPGQPNVYYSATDGGLSQAPDITAPSMEWVSLNHGYNVTQFYSLSIAPEAGSDLILAGAQDNGSQLGNAPGASDWTMAYGGDGTVVEVAPAADDRLYTQTQNGPIQRQTRGGSGITSMTPSGAANQLFVNPIVLDPNDSSRLYYAAGVSLSSSRIWRNDVAPNATSTVGWTSLAATEVGAGSGYARRISAIGISTRNDPNILYYGTVDGLLFRADGANTAAPIVTNITPPGLDGGTAVGGFVRCIAVDPGHSDRALVAFGNYNFRSLWYTTDGGATWTDVEGNLAGPSGPSIRWASMFFANGSLQVFLGTSVGVLSTTSLAGAATTWIQEAADAIGNVIIAYMDYRPSDLTLAVGTHARGVFTTRFAPTVSAGDARETGRLVLSRIHPNPVRGEAMIVYELPRTGAVSLRMYDLSGRHVATLVDGKQDRGRHEARFTPGRLASGAYYCVLKSGEDVQTRKLSVIH